MLKTHQTIPFAGLLLASVSLATMATAATQDSAPSSTTPGLAIEDRPSSLEEIVVTARRQSERLQSTPVAVTAVTSEKLDEAQIQNAVDLQRIAPSLSIQTAGHSAGGVVYVSIRGQNAQSPGTAVDSPVATYVDGVYIPRPSQGQTDFVDLERVEVLRGPQGTLFGRNTTGGALNIITAQPSDRHEFVGRVESGNYNAHAIGATVNMPLAEGLAGRLTASFRERDGYSRNDLLDRDAGDSKSAFVRGKLLYTADRWDVTLSADYNKISDHGQHTGLLAYSPEIYAKLAGGPAAAAILDRYLHTDAKWYRTYGTGYILPTQTPESTAIFNGLPQEVQNLYSKRPFNETEAYGFSGTVNVDLGNGLSLKSITAYRYSDSTGLVDVDGTPVPILTTAAGFGSDQWSQELQLSGAVRERFRYVVGAFYGHEEGYQRTASQSFGFFPTPRFINENFADVTNKTLGLFAQGYYDLTDQVRLAAGLRWTWDERGMVGHNKSIYGDPSSCNLAFKDPGSVCDQTRDAEFDYPAWMLGIDYQWNPDVFLYAKTSHAAKAGGWNLNGANLPAFEPEKLTDVELGAKVDWFDNRLRTNVATFYSWTEGTQRQIGIIANGVPAQYLTNAGNTEIYGVEFEVIAIPWRGMELRGNLSLTEGSYEDGTYKDVRLLGGIPVTVDRSGEPLPQLPGSQFMISGTQSVPVSFGDLQFHLSYSYIASQYNATVTPTPGMTPAMAAPYIRQNELAHIDGYGLLNGRLSLTLNNPDIELFAFGRNLTNEKYVNRTFADLYAEGLGFANRTVGAPLTFGIGATIKFH